MQRRHLIQSAATLAVSGLAFESHAQTSAQAFPGRPLKLIVGEPISTVRMTTRDAEALTERLRAVIYETYVAEHEGR